jgi:uncharacterized membrane protein
VADNPRVRRHSRPTSLVVVLAATIFSLGLGFLIKSPCLGSWSDGRQYNRLCYSDVAALYASEDRDRGLDQDRVPYVDGENEYPVLTGLFMGLAALPADSYASFFVWTAALLTVCALATSWALHRAAGGNALLFALSPTLAIYGFLNWDLLAVALATGATLAHLRRRGGAAGVLLGLGTAAKLYPGLLLVPFAVGLVRKGRRGDAQRMLGAAAIAWGIVNLPLAAASPERWSEFFRFNAERSADWDSVWFLLQRHLGVTWDPSTVNVLAAASFVGIAALLWRAASRRGVPAWTFGFPLLVVFLLTSKVYSPQYGLWLIPWFALVLPDLRLFAAFQAADVAVFVTRFQFFARYGDTGEGLPFWSFELAVLIRAAILVVCVVAWLRRQPEPRPLRAALVAESA